MAVKINKMDMITLVEKEFGINTKGWGSGSIFRGFNFDGIVCETNRCESIIEIKTEDSFDFNKEYLNFPVKMEIYTPKGGIKGAKALMEFFHGEIVPAVKKKEEEIKALASALEEQLRAGNAVVFIGSYGKKFVALPKDGVRWNIMALFEKEWIIAHADSYLKNMRIIPKGEVWNIVAWSEYYGECYYIDVVPQGAKTEEALSRIESCYYSGAEMHPCLVGTVDNS